MQGLIVTGAFLQTPHYSFFQLKLKQPKMKCPHCQQTFEIIDLTKDEEDANTPREVLVLDSEQPDGSGERASISSTVTERSDTVPSLPTRGGERAAYAPPTGVRRIRFESDSEPSEGEDIPALPYRTPQRYWPRGQTVLQKRRWAPRRPMGVRRVYRDYVVKRQSYRS